MNVKEKYVNIWTIKFIKLSRKTFFDFPFSFQNIIFRDFLITDWQRSHMISFIQGHTGLHSGLQFTRQLV